MEAAPYPRIYPAPSSTAVTGTPPPAVPPTPPRQPEVVTALPRCAILAGVFLLGALTALLGVHALTYLRLGTEPSKIVEAQPITYRVDLNQARRAELLQLPGIGPNLADRIEAYRQEAGGFHSVEDLLKVKGIGPATMERVRPFVDIKNAQALAAPEPVAKSGKATTSASTKLASAADPIDINQATLTELQKLPGIGPKMSQRIVDERERRPFASVSELRRVAGIGPKTFERLKPLVTVK
jgi:competence protein ComEA